MRTILAGDGTDATSAVVAFLKANNQLRFADLYLIGEPEYPDSLFLTDYEAPLNYPIVGTFQPSDIKRNGIQTKVGLEVNALTVEWTPVNRTFSSTTLAAGQTSPLQLAQTGYYDNWNVRLWRAVMPTPGDVNTYGAMEWFGGRIAASSVSRSKITWTVNSFLEVVNQYVPNNVVENTNVRAGYVGSTPTPGDAAKAVFSVIAGSNDIIIIGAATYPTANKIYSTHALQGAYLVFLGGSSATLGGYYGPIADNTTVTISGHNYNQIQLFQPMPWAPTPGSDTFFVSSKPPVDASEGTIYGFPYVPVPESAVGGV